MGAFSGLSKASRGYTSNPLKPGRYIARIDECSFFDTANDGEMWKNTLTILAVEDGPHKVGDVVHSFFRMKPGKSVFQSNLKNFIASVMDCADDEVDEAAAEHVSSDKQPLAGYVVEATPTQRVSKKTTAKDGGPVTYTVYGWSRRMTGAEIVEAVGEETVEKFKLDVS